MYAGEGGGVNDARAPYVVWIRSNHDGMHWHVDEIKPDHSIKIRRPRTELERYGDRTNDDRMGWLTPMGFELTFGMTIYDVMGVYL